MKRSILTGFILFAALSFVSAQNRLNSNFKVVSLGAGFGTPFWGKGYSSSLPFNPTLSIERGLLDNVSVGTTIAYNRSTFSDWDYLKLTTLYLAGRGAYHFSAPNDNVDLYAGGSLGYGLVFLSAKGSGAFDAGSRVAYSLFVGGRYYFTKKTAVYAELGYGSFSLANVGISIRAR